MVVEVMVVNRDEGETAIMTETVETETVGTETVGAS